MNRSFYELNHVATKRYVVSFTFLPNGTSAPTWQGGSTPIGVASIARSGVGLFNITLQDKYVALDSHSVSLMLNAAADTQAELKSEDVDGTKVLTVRTKTAGADADIAANANNRVSVILVLKGTTTG